MNENMSNTIPDLQPGTYVIVFDTETTGLDRSADRIIQFSAVRYRATGGYGLMEMGK